PSRLLSKQNQPKQHQHQPQLQLLRPKLRLALRQAPRPAEPLSRPMPPLQPALRNNHKTKNDPPWVVFYFSSGSLKSETLESMLSKSPGLPLNSITCRLSFLPNGYTRR